MPAAKMTDEERQAYREAKRQEAEDSLDRLLTEEGWATWLRLRRNLHSFSWGNQVLIAVQCWQLEIENPTIVKAAWRWKKDGYHPAKGSRGIYIWTPMDRKRKGQTHFVCCGQPWERTCGECGKQSVHFVLKPVFDASQVVSFDDGQPPEVAMPETVPVTGDEHGWMVEQLAAHAVKEDWCSDVQLSIDSERGEGGWFRPKDRVIGVCKGAGNHQLRVLIHELAHAQGLHSGGDHGLTYAEAEVAVECVSFIVASTAGLDTSSEAVPYMAGWGGEGAREKVRKLAGLIDAAAKQLEGPILDLIEQREAVVA